MVRVLVEPAESAEDDVEVLVREEAPLRVDVGRGSPARAKRLQGPPQSSASPQLAGFDTPRPERIERVQNTGDDSGGVVLLELGSAREEGQPRVRGHHVPRQGEQVVSIGVRPSGSSHQDRKQPVRGGKAGEVLGEPTEQRRRTHDLPGLHQRAPQRRRRRRRQRRRRERSEQQAKRLAAKNRAGVQALGVESSREVGAGRRGRPARARQLQRRRRRRHRRRRAQKSGGAGCGRDGRNRPNRRTEWWLVRRGVESGAVHAALARGLDDALEQRHVRRAGRVKLGGRGCLSRPTAASLTGGWRGAIHIHRMGAAGERVGRAEWRGGRGGPGGRLGPRRRRVDANWRERRRGRERPAPAEPLGGRLNVRGPERRQPRRVGRRADPDRVACSQRQRLSRPLRRAGLRADRRPAAGVGRLAVAARLQLVQDAMSQALRLGRGPPLQVQLAQLVRHRIGRRRLDHRPHRSEARTQGRQLATLRMIRPP
mmetsp:Transcript_24325/g.78446  ORF Transcript_24325/g.78446 Transcript_24325/m.78446 type:complete len:483 (+) Transcript_24325:652-2100(+)|eukprot:scaffold4593_cov125-Isochrysis_galbana.AAC.2